MKPTQETITQAFARTHASLLEDLRRLEDDVRPGSKEGLAELRTRLVDTHKLVTAHFRFEEQNGYMEAVRKRDPHSEEKIQELGEEHRLLAHSLEAIVGDARTATSLDDELRKKVRMWIERIRHHETSENDLIQDTLCQDLGSKD